jgi:hypothetical protein
MPMVSRASSFPVSGSVRPDTRVVNFWSLMQPMTLIRILIAAPYPYIETLSLLLEDKQSFFMRQLLRAIGAFGRLGVGRAEWSDYHARLIGAAWHYRPGTMRDRARCLVV